MYLNAFAELSSEVRLASVNLRYESDKVRVPYQLINGKTNNRNVVWVKFFNEKNQQLTAKSLQGDIILVNGVDDKLFIWVAKADGLVLKEKLTARLSAKLIPSASTDKALAYSTLFLGQAITSTKKVNPTG